MNDSQRFSAVLRLVSFMMSGSEELSEQERTWLHFMTERYIEDPEERALLLSESYHGSSLDSLFLLISPTDYPRLMAWAKIGVQIDGVDRIESRMCEQLQRLIAESPKQDRVEAKDLASAILTATRERQFWTDLREVGTFWGRRVDLSKRTSLAYFFFQGFFSGNRLLLMSIVVVLAVLTLLRIIFPVARCCG